MTIKDIAKLSGYSVGTVSRVLNDSSNVSKEARRAITAVVDQYHFNRNTNARYLKQQAASGIAIIVKGAHNMLFAGIMERLQNRIKEHGFAGMVYYIDEEDNEVRHAWKIILERHPRGILFLGSDLKNFRSGFAGLTIPCVLVTNSAAALGFENLSSVTTDDASAAQFAVEHLIELGHRRIGILGGKADLSGTARIRLDGCMRALQKHGLSFEPHLQYIESRFSLDGGYHGMKTLLEQLPGLSAVFAMSDVMAVGALRAVCDSGLQVPDDISVIGFDGIDLVHYLNPKFTTIRQRSDSIADRSFEILLRRCMEEKAPAAHEVIDFDFISGESVRKIKIT